MNHPAEMIPVLGARSAKQLADNMAAIEWSLSEEQYKRLDEVSAINMGFPHGFLDGATFDKIDGHRA